MIYKNAHFLCRSVKDQGFRLSRPGGEVLSTDLSTRIVEIPKAVGKPLGCRVVPAHGRDRGCDLGRGPGRDLGPAPRPLPCRPRGIDRRSQGGGARGVRRRASNPLNPMATRARWRS